MPLLLECVGARGLESDTYFEMALRDVLLIPGLEGSMHINLRLAGQFVPRYFDRADDSLPVPASLSAETVPVGENAYLASAAAGNARAVGFRHFLAAYRPLAAIPNVALFARQAAAFRRFVKGVKSAALADLRVDLALGRGVAAIAYGQLIAENAVLMGIPPPVVSAIFGLLVGDMSGMALQMAAIPKFDATSRGLIQRMVKVPRTGDEEWEFIIRCAEEAMG